MPLNNEDGTTKVESVETMSSVVDEIDEMRSQGSLLAYISRFGCVQTICEAKRMQIESRIAEVLAWEEYRLRQLDTNPNEASTAVYFQMGLEVALNIVKELKS